MNEDDKRDNLFAIRLTKEGAYAALRFIKIASWVFGIMLLAAVVNIIQSVILISIFNSRYFRGNTFLLFRQRIYPYVTILYFMIAVVQSWYYWQTAKKLSAGVRDNNEQQFNQAFHLLYRHGVFAVITLTVGFILNAFQLFVFVRSYFHP